ncbi:ferritin-like domain-containing protein [Gordonia rubripertincta]|uniref:Ferritin-like domain-containing protein n=1 Tax=Gordonia rubripertincta TaxID=36822 RepID=A0ABT4MWF7_GORRU|nr:ferritin-like domain-containing protein [Gordonia rubripertincta]MCZ4550376.1 ferritin-like domain-containing protein [Gordonia rubripertincta]
MTRTTDALTVALTAENAAIFAYGVVAAYAASSRSQTIAEYTAEHRSRREELVAALTAAQAEVPAAAAGYDLSAPITDPASALTVALTAEEDCAVAYRALIEQAEDVGARRLGLGGLTDSAGRAANWRLVLRISPVTVALPGSV